MDTTRRDFLGRLATNAAMLGAMPLAFDPRALASAGAAEGSSGGSAEPWDLTWVKRITGKHRVVFDVPEVESGYGVWRATVWTKQYAAVLGTLPADMSAVVVLRHNGIVLAMQQAFWDRYGIGKAKSVTHPVTLEPTDRNPVLLSSARGEVPAPYDAMALDRFLARGGIALACDLALADCVALIRAKDGVSDEAAREQALGHLVPGVVLQPSGVFAAIRAQEAGAIYLRAS